MIRLVNQFDSSEHLPSTMVASGGANCSSCTSSSSCIVTAVVISVVSARMTPRLANTGARTPKRAWQRIALSAAIFPLVILSVFLGIQTFDVGLGAMAFVIPPFIYLGYLAYISWGTAKRIKFVGLHILLVVAWLALSVVEVMVWAMIMDA